jgi:hypothetical protein
MRLSQYGLYWQSNITQINGYVVNGYGSTGTLIMLVYDDLGGAPHNLVYASSPIPVPPNSSVTLSCSPNLSVNAGNYWVGYSGSNADYTDVASGMDQTPGAGNFIDFENVTTIPSVAPAYTASNGDWKGSYALSETWVVCHQPIPSPTPTVTMSPTPTLTYTVTPTGTIPTLTFTPTPTPT